MNIEISRIAINAGAGFVPGINSVIKGAALAAGNLGWEVFGIRDGFDGLPHPECYPDGGLVPLSPQLIENLDPAPGVSWPNRSGSIRFMSARSIKIRWLMKWTCPMFC